MSVPTKTLFLCIVCSSVSQLFLHKEGLGLNHLTTWWLLLTIACLLLNSNPRAKQDAKWVSYLTSVIGLLVMLLHWTLVSQGYRPKLSDRNTIRYATVYTLLPILVILSCSKHNVYSGNANAAYKSVATFVVVYSFLSCRHDSLFPGEKTYDRLPYPMEWMCLVGGVFSLLLTKGLHTLSPKADWFPTLS